MIQREVLDTNPKRGRRPDARLRAADVGGRRRGRQGAKRPAGDPAQGEGGAANLKNGFTTADC